MLSIIIINYNTFEMTCRCIESVVQYTKDLKYEIVLVDNASAECDASLFKDKFPFIKLVKNPENNGFAKGNNLGISYSEGDTILLLNSDTLLKDNAPKIAYDYLMQNSKAGVVGVRLVYPDGKIQHTVRRFKTIKWELLDLFRFLPYLLPKKKRVQLMLGKYFDGSYNTTCDWIGGAFFMFPKKLVGQLPEKKLNDDFFMYGEDTLWCYDIGKLGYEIHFISSAEVIHLSQGSSDLKKQIKTFNTMFQHELILYRKRGNSGWKCLLFKLIYVPKERSRLLVRELLSALGFKLLR